MARHRPGGQRSLFENNEDASGLRTTWIFMARVVIDDLRRVAGLSGELWEDKDTAEQKQDDVTITLVQTAGHDPDSVEAESRRRHETAGEWSTSPEQARGPRTFQPG